MALCPLKHVSCKKWGTCCTHDALHTHKGYCYHWSLLNLNVKILQSIGLLFTRDKRNCIAAMTKCYWITSSSHMEAYYGNQLLWEVLHYKIFSFVEIQQLFHFPLEKAHTKWVCCEVSRSIFSVFVCWQVELRPHYIYNFSDFIARYMYFGWLWKFRTSTKNSRFCGFTWLISNLWKLSLLMQEMRLQKRILYQKLHSW